MAVITYGDVDVALLAILLREPQMTEAWVRSVLGPFAAVGMRNLQMRQTLAAHFGTGENFSRTADVLGVHRNTVARRVARFAEEAGKSNVSGLDIALAVRLYDVFASKDEPFT
jgi:DNA-binding PucR family transcriptional regulator